MSGSHLHWSQRDYRETVLHHGSCLPPLQVAVVQLQRPLLLVQRALLRVRQQVQIPEEARYQEWAHASGNSDCDIRPRPLVVWLLRRQAAGDGHDTESNNLGIGRGALGGSIAGGEFNVAVGNYTLDALTSGDNNVAIGYNAGTGITSSSLNTIVGDAAAGYLSSGDGKNTVIGKDCFTSGTALTTRYNNISLDEFFIII